ncbi:MAG TPA: hypothetical protein VM532_04960 [Burkholderiales bacterium]|nr:hypothetical protein [Burkholderiales bacterium]
MASQELLPGKVIDLTCRQFDTAEKVPLLFPDLRKRSAGLYYLVLEIRDAKLTTSSSGRAANPQQVLNLLPVRALPGLDVVNFAPTTLVFHIAAGDLADAVQNHTPAFS